MPYHGNKAQPLSIWQCLKKNSYEHSRHHSIMIWRLAWPLMLSSLSSPLLGLADIAIIGHLDNSQYLAAIAIGSTLFTTLIWAFGFLKAGTTGLSAATHGKTRTKKLNTLLIQTLLLANILATSLILLQTPLIQGACKLLSAPPSSVTSVLNYSHIRILGLPASLSTLVLIGWLIGKQDSKTPMLILISTNLINILLNILFVYGLQWDIRGVAYGTVLSEYIGLSIGLVAIYRTLSKNKPPASFDLPEVFKLNAYRKLLSVNSHLFIRTLFLLTTFSFFTRQSAIMGQDYLAVNEILKTFLLIIALLIDGFSHALEALTGAAWGQQQYKRFHQIVIVGFFWAITTSILLSFVFLIFGGSIFNGLTDIEHLWEIADHYLTWVILLPISSIWCFVLDGIFIGTTQSKAMRDTMAFSTLGVFFPVWYMTTTWGNHGLWFAMHCFFIARGASLGWLYYRIFIKKEATTSAEADKPEAW